MTSLLPYCGAPPLPSTLAGRFNLDPWLIACLIGIAAIHLLRVRQGHRLSPLAGWLVAAAALLSPLCALSVALFSARVGQHMVLVLIAAPLIARGLPGRTGHAWPAATAFMLLLWLWHMPVPYAATFASPIVYWAMHVSLFGSAIWLWTALLRPEADGAGSRILAGTLTSMQMGLLGAVLGLAGRPMFAAHYLTTAAWGLSPLEDQQLGGTIMWVPGIFLFMVVALQSARFAWGRHDEALA